MRYYICTVQCTCFKCTVWWILRTLYTHHKHFYYRRIFPCHPRYPPSLPSTPAITDLCHHYRLGLSSLEFHVSEIIQYVLCCECFLAQKNVFETFLWYRLVPFYSEKYCFIWIYCYHSPVYGYLGCFQFFAVTNEASMKICVQILVRTYFHFSSVNTSLG